jgi:hypothetical protein
MICGCLVELGTMEMAQLDTSTICGDSMFPKLLPLGLKQTQPPQAQQKLPQALKPWEQQELV